MASESSTAPSRLYPALENYLGFEVDMGTEFCIVHMWRVRPKYWPHTSIHQGWSPLISVWLVILSGLILMASQASVNWYGNQILWTEDTHLIIVPENTNSISLTPTNTNACISKLKYFGAEFFDHEEHSLDSHPENSQALKNSGVACSSEVRIFASFCDWSVDYRVALVSVARSW